jgi:membrane-associated protease RseP (regulator of RpoE activity)
MTAPTAARGLILAAVLWLPAVAEESGYGNLDFSKLTKTQADFFWTRLKSLAVEEAVLGYCGEADNFEVDAKQGIRACVTEEALNKADAFFKAEGKQATDALQKRRASCHGKPKADRGWLGVELEPAGDKGALVTGAVDGSPAASADLKAGDIITAVNGDAIAGPKELSGKIRGFSPGATVNLGVSRADAARTVSIKLGAMAFDADGHTALDMPAMVVASKQDLKSVADEVTSMCQKCKTSIWAVFCR